MSNSFTEWDINNENLTLMLRDNASNAIRACDIWQIPHFGCIGHTLHLIVGPLFVDKNSTNDNKTDKSTNETTLEEEFLGDIVDYDDGELEEVSNNFEENYKVRVKHIAKVVGNFRKVAKFIQKSNIAKEKINNIQRTNNRSEISVEIGICLRWNSTLHMLQKFVRLKTSLCFFLQYLKTSKGKRDLNNKSLPTFSEEDWALIEVLCIILKIFAIAIEALSAEEHPTFVYAMSILRKIKLHLSRNDLFWKDCEAEDLKQFCESYREDTFKSSILSTLETIRFCLLNGFKTRFNNMTIDIL